MVVFVFTEGSHLLASVDVRQVLFAKPSDDYRKLELHLSTGETVEIKFKQACTIQYREFNQLWEAANPEESPRTESGQEARRDKPCMLLDYLRGILVH